MSVKVMNYKQFQEFAMKNYAKGGDCVVECWDEESFRVYCAEFGPMTEKEALSLFRLYSSCGM